MRSNWYIDIAPIHYVDIEFEDGVLVGDPYLLAISTETEPEILEVLAQVNCPIIRREIAENPKTPIHVLAILAQDSCPYVRDGVAENPYTPVEILKQLAKDDYPQIRASVALNPNTPDEIVEELKKDETVAEYLERYLNN